MIRQQIEEGFDNIAEVEPEIRGIVASLICYPSFRPRKIDVGRRAANAVAAPDMTIWRAGKKAARGGEVEAVGEPEAIEKG